MRDFKATPAHTPYHLSTHLHTHLFLRSCRRPVCTEPNTPGVSRLHELTPALYACCPTPAMSLHKSYPLSHHLAHNHTPPPTHPPTNTLLIQPHTHTPSHPPTTPPAPTCLSTLRSSVARVKLSRPLSPPGGTTKCDVTANTNELQLALNSCDTSAPFAAIAAAAVDQPQVY